MGIPFTTHRRLHRRCFRDTGKGLARGVEGWDQEILHNPRASKAAYGVISGRSSTLETVAEGVASLCILVGFDSLDAWPLPIELL